jgi:hypothetical protein
MDDVFGDTARESLLRRLKEWAKLAYTIPEAVPASGLSRSMLYVAIGRGELRAVKYGTRTLVLAEDLRNFLRRLPPFVAKTTQHHLPVGVPNRNDDEQAEEALERRRIRRKSRAGRTASRAEREAVP